NGRRAPRRPGPRQPRTACGTASGRRFAADDLEIDAPIEGAFLRGVVRCAWFSRAPPFGFDAPRIDAAGDEVRGHGFGPPPRQIEVERGRSRIVGVPDDAYANVRIRLQHRDRLVEHGTRRRTDRRLV